MRNLISKPKKSPLQGAWTKAERQNKIEKFEEEVVFNLTPKEAEKCRYTIINPDTRMAECLVHTKSFTHGIKLHPPHLYKLEDGIVFYKSNDSWVRWFPDYAANKKRFLDNS